MVISSLGGGGAERIMSILASAWAEQHKKVTILTLDQGEKPGYPLHPSVEVCNLGLQGLSNNLSQSLAQNFRRLKELRRAIRKSAPQIVISCLDTTNILTLLATRRLKLPVIIMEQTDPALYHIGRAWSALRRMVYPLADALVCPVNASLARFQKMTRVRGQTIPNFVHVPCSPARVNKRDSQGRVLIAMGRLVHQKGFDLLLQAFAQIAGRHPQWTLTILGEGPLRSELQSQTEALHLQERVHFAGAVANPFSVLRAADLFVFSSRFEGFGMALAEAMACGLPAVSFNCPEGPAELIRNGIDGILVPPEDASALAKVLDRLMGDDQERQRLAERAPDVLERFSRDRILSIWQELFDKLLSGDRGSD